jgi:predicted DCC family thiol-disulfide oxidoreductase YuxK
MFVWSFLLFDGIDYFQKMEWKGLTIVFYDGDCGFCNKTVQFVLSNEKNTSIHFCALQSKKAHQFFKEMGEKTPDMSTFYFFAKGRLYSESTGALVLASYLRFPYNMLQIGWLIPAFIRNGIYRFIAKRRQKLAAGFCALPSPDQAKRFIR